MLGNYVNVPGLVVAGLFLAAMACLFVRATVADRGRLTRSRAYKSQENPAAVPAHTWQPEPVSRSLSGLPDAETLAHAPAWVRWWVHQGEQRVRIENAQSTTINGWNLTVFDHFLEQLDDGGTRFEHTVRGVFDFGAHLPALQIGAQRGIATFGGGRSRMTFGFDDFDHAFFVTGADAQFGSSLLDVQMMRWLLAHPTLRSLEIEGAHALVAFEADSSDDTDEAIDPDAVLAFVAGFLARIPPVVYSTWGSRSPA